MREALSKKTIILRCCVLIAVCMICMMYQAKVSAGVTAEYTVGLGETTYAFSPANSGLELFDFHLDCPSTVEIYIYVPGLIYEWPALDYWMDQELQTHDTDRDWIDGNSTCQYARWTYDLWTGDHSLVVCHGQETMAEDINYQVTITCISETTGGGNGAMDKAEAQTLFYNYLYTEYPEAHNWVIYTDGELQGNEYVFVYRAPTGARGTYYVNIYTGDLYEMWEMGSQILEPKKFTVNLFEYSRTHQGSTPQPAVVDYSRISVGDCVFFGSYEQDNNPANGAEPIEWEVLDVKDGKALLVSKYALDGREYHYRKEAITWDKCTLRSWLNYDFYSAAFSGQEQGRIVETLIETETNRDYGTSGGNPIQDRVFLLSLEDIERYYGYDPYDDDYPRINEMRVKATDYAVARGTWVVTEDVVEDSPNVLIDSDIGVCWWWLRSAGNTSSDAANVYHDGSIYNYGLSVDTGCGGVRPALWMGIGS